MDLGGIDESHVNESQIIYHPVVAETYWEIAAGQPIVDGQRVGTSYLAAVDTGSSLFRSTLPLFSADVCVPYKGTTLIYLPTEIVRAFYAAIPGASRAGLVSGGEFYKYPCDYAEPRTPSHLSFPSIMTLTICSSVALTFMDNNNVERAYNINPKDFNLGTFEGQCVGAVMGLDFTDTSGRPLAIIGNAFLKEWYSVSFPLFSS